MKSYPPENWKALGEWVSVARHQAGYSDTKRWAHVVGRSTRMLLGLERGEPVGAKTIEAISEALGVANWAVFEILDSGEPDSVSWTDVQVEAARQKYETETGLEADGGGGDGLLWHFSDEELLEELRRRLATRPLSRSERRMQEVKERWGEPLSEPSDTTGGLVAADEQDRPISGEAEESDTP